ncbi:MAG TPA: 4-hydroxybenzoate octaprenyltransferase [Deltaproteobacteria bacterium]|nr:4-hydroxybenzoate octaprenyltransferase [Deltaproteobacteria bacterium]
MNATTPALKKLSAIGGLIRIDKQYGTALLLLPTLWGLVMASEGRPSLKHLLVFTVGSFLMRSAGCAINDIADRNFDRHVERTRTRPLASGELTVGEAAAVFVVLSLLAFALVLTLNRLTVLLSVAALALASLYPLAKRVSRAPQAVLGMAFGWGAVMAWTAVRGSIAAVPVLIFLANVCWSLAYDTIYALMDREDDLKIGVKSTAILFGERVFEAVSAFYWAMALLLAAAGALHGAGWIYMTGVAASLAFFLSTTAKIKKKPTREAAMKGFVANVWGGTAILTAIVLDLNTGKF